MSWIGGVTAILGLIFGLQQLFGVVGGWRQKQQRTAELIAVAREQRESRHYAEAWSSLEEAAKVDDDNAAVAAAQEDLAMVWLREARVRVGEQTFSDLVKPLLPVLERGALKADGSRKADLLAHAGWADFLRWRDGARDVAADAQYKRALDVDAKNPFAHAMWGHWILFTGGDVKSARDHFDAAMSSNRERKYVRSLQVAAVTNMSGDDGSAEQLRLANDMRQHGDSMDEASRRRIFWEICITSARHTEGWKRSPDRISPNDEIATLRWLATGNRDEYRADMLQFCEARASAWAGDTVRALNTLRRLETNAAGDATRWDAKQVAQRLAQSHKR
ncbi:MAG TPA: hypothetical protein VGD49_03795 [Longimicrobiales bacterium]